MKKDGRGQAAIFENNDFQRLIDATVGENHKMIFHLAYWTAARCGEVRRLPTEAVFTADGKVHEMITFWSEITKDQQNRQVPVSGVLKGLLERYWLVMKPSGFYLFPGQKEMTALHRGSIDNALRRAIAKAGLESRGYSCHSFRRTAITKMSAAGVATSVIQKISGHESLTSLQRYIEVSDQQVKGAIATL